MMLVVFCVELLQEGIQIFLKEFCPMELIQTLKTTIIELHFM